MATSWSTLHTSRIVQPPPSSYPTQIASSSKTSRSTKPRVKLPSQTSDKMDSSLSTPMSELPTAQPDPLAFASGSRSSSLAGRKRPRDSDGTTSATHTNRRTKSVGDTREARNSKDREAFQRGLIAVFVPKALRDSARGDKANYNDLLAHFLPTPSTPTPSLPPLLPLLRAISAHVSLLVPEAHGALVSAILDLPWAYGDERFVKTFVGWAGVLVSAHPTWTKEVVHMAVRGLAWQNPTRSASDSPISRRTYHARHHLLLSHLLSLVPTLPNLLGPILVRKFPNKRETEVVQTTWVRNMCELIAYCPELGARIWGEIVDRMLRIDVEINNSLEDEEDEEDEDDDDEVDAPTMSSSAMLDPFDLTTAQDVPKLMAEEDDEDSDDETEVDPGDVSSADGERSDEDKEEQDETKLLNQAEKKRQAVKAMREKLDGMLFYFFRHLEEWMGDGERRQSAAEMAAERVGGLASSGQSTPTSESGPTFGSSYGGAGTTTPSITPARPAPTPAQSLAHFQTLLNLFTRQILPTSSTQHIPFLLFLCSSFSHAHTDLFLGLLVSQALYASTTASPSAAAQPVSLPQRIAATVYIGSVVCRARFVSDESARQVLTYLLAYIDGKLNQPTGYRDELPLVYAVCQAVMLIFCFRWRAFTTEAGGGTGGASATDDGEGVLGDMELEGDIEAGEGKWMRDLDVLQRAITSDLNPLLGCNGTVVNTFAKVAHHTNFAYCFSIIEANQQSTARSSSTHSLSKGLAYAQQAQTPTTAAPGSVSASFKLPIGPGAASRQNSVSSTFTVPRKARQANIDAGLDSYYPFDPFTLPRSKRFIDNLYRTWGEVSIPLDDDEDESSDEEEEDEDEDGSDADSEMGGAGRQIQITKPVSLPKHKGSWTDPRRRLMAGASSGGRDDGLSSSLEGMSISPGVAGYMRRP